jgi:hypothetical protein
MVKHTKMVKIFLITTQYSKGPNSVQTFIIPRPSKIYPFWDFGYENIPSGNPVCRPASKVFAVLSLPHI